MSDRIRVLEPDGSAPRREPERQRPLPTVRSVPVAAVAVGFGVLGILIGYLFGAAQPGDDSPTLEAGGVSAVDHNTDPDVATPFGTPVPEAGIDSTSPPTTTEPTVTTQASPLGELVPGFDGTLSWVDFRGSVFRWNARSREPNVIDVPIESWGHGWSPNGSRILYVSGNRNPALYVGVPGATEPIALQVAMAAWHATDNNQIAWLGSLDGETLSGRHWTAPLQLSVSNLAGGTRQITTLDVVEDFDVTEWFLVAWNDDGFAFIRNAWSETSPKWQSTVVVVDDSGAVVFEEVDATWLSTLADGSLVVAEIRYNAIATGDDSNPRILELDGSTAPVTLASNITRAIFSPDGRYLATLDGLSRLSLEGPDGTVDFTRLADDALWSRDGRFLVASLADGAFLLFYDVETGAEHIIKIAGGSAYNLRVH